MKRFLLSVAAAAFALSGLAGSVLAQDYPEKPVTVIVPYPTGGGTDVLGRVLTQALSEATGEQFVVENRPGGDATIGADAAAHSDPDGYTLLVVSGAPFSINQTVFANTIRYDALESFEPVSLFAAWPLVLLAHPSVPADNVEEFFAYAKERPGELNYAGSDQVTFLTMEMMKQATDTDMLHVSYPGVGPSIVDLLGGHVDVMLSSIGPALPHISDNALKPLAVTGKTQSSALPDVPTLDETVIPGFDVIVWYGMFAPAGTPAEVVDFLNRKIAEVMEVPEVRDHFKQLGADIMQMSPAEFRTFLEADIATWAEAVENAGIPIQ